MTIRGFLELHRKKLLPVAVAFLGLVAVTFLWRNTAGWFTGPADTTFSDSGRTVHAGPFQIEAIPVPDPPRERGNSLRLRLTAGGQPVNDAEILVTYRMPPMGSMQEMRAKADVEASKDGQYTASFDLPMGGTWTLKVAVQQGDRSGEATFNMTVGTRGLTATGQSGTREESKATVPSLPSHEFDAATLGYIRAAFGAYEQARAILARDTVDVTVQSIFLVAAANWESWMHERYGPKIGRRNFTSA